MAKRDSSSRRVDTFVDNMDPSPASHLYKKNPNNQALKRHLSRDKVNKLED